jgi:hypothetical protein
MSSVVNVDGVMRVVRRPVPRIELLTVEDLKDPKRVVRAYNSLLELVTQLSQESSLPYVEFEDVEVSVGVMYTLRHGLNGRVRFWVTEWQGTASQGFTVVTASSDDNTLVLQAIGPGVSGKATFRVQRSE